jgi:hypothetical protein
MKIYIANATNQVISFLYRLPEQTGVRHQHIPVGSQIRLPEDITPEMLDSILDQHTRYGLISVDEVQNVQEFKGTCYSVDKPVPAMKIEMLMDHNRDELVELGKRLRQEAALTSNDVLENELQESGRPEILRNLEISVVEENPDPRNETAPVAEGFRVQREGESQYAPPRGQQNQGRKNRR